MTDSSPPSPSSSTPLAPISHLIPYDPRAPGAPLPPSPDTMRSALPLRRPARGNDAPLYRPFTTRELEPWELRIGSKLGLTPERIRATDVEALCQQLHPPDRRHTLLPPSRQFQPGAASDTSLDPHPHLPAGAAQHMPLEDSSIGPTSAEGHIEMSFPDHHQLQVPPATAAMLSPGVNTEEPMGHAFEAALAFGQTSSSPHLANATARTGSDSSHSSQGGKVAGLMTPAPLTEYISKQSCSSDAAQAVEEERLPARGNADGIGGSCVGTAATGDLGERHEFESLEDIRAQVAELETDYNEKHPDRQLSGRIIHVSHYIPFVIRALAEVDFERQREVRLNAASSVAAMAAAARARKAAKLAAEKAQAEKLERLAAAEAEEADGSKTAGPQVRKGSFLEGMHETTDFEKRLAENQARSKLKAGRRAWMMTPVVDDEAVEEEDEESLKDTYTPIGSRRGSTWTEGASSRSMSFANNEQPARFSAVSNEISPERTPPRPARPASPPPPPPQWVLAPRRGHTALNSGIRSLCKTHRQTFIGWPGDIQFPVQARADERKDASETTDEEKRQIEQVLGALDDAKNWAAQDAPILGGRTHDGGAKLGPVRSSEEATSKVPTPLMNGAEPVNADAAQGSNAGQGATENGIKYVPVWLDYNVAHGHYEGYCKTTLWPLLHYLLWQDVPASRRVNWDEYSWEAYLAANEAYAKRIAEEYKPGDLVWIHDYHLLLVPQMLRKLVPDAHIGLFVHSPFPSSEIFRCLPQRKEIIEGMLGADLACFQAFSYSRHFLSSCIRVCGFEASANTVECSNGHITNISYNPIGIDALKIAKDAASPGVLPKIETIRAMYKGKKIIIGRDKLDVVRGVIQKLQAFHKFLEEFPEWREKVVLIQVTAPALNDSPLLERKVSELVSHINGEFGSLSFTPVHHYHQIIERDEYFALLSVADLALITSVRDGMNTTSMEFIVAQERYGKNPLVLSEFTGTAGRMRAALQVNPWNVVGVAKTIHYGLSMSQEEKVARHDQLFHQVVSHTSHSWASTLVRQLVTRLQSEHSAHFTPPLDRQTMLDRFHSASKRLLCLDYDGTLTPIVKDPEAALPSALLLDSLKTLSEDPKNLIFIISGRDQRFLTKHLGHLTNIGFSAEHGGYVKEPGEEMWHNLTQELDMSWMADVRKIFEYFTERTSGSFIEEKKSSMTWHYRNADPDYGSFQAKECQAHLDNMTAQQNLAVEVLVGKKNLECRPLAVNKGEIVKRILYKHNDAEFVFCAGDDKTDEDMFRTLCNLSPANTGSANSPRTTTTSMISNPDRGHAAGSGQSSKEVRHKSESLIKALAESSVERGREKEREREQQSRNASSPSSAKRDSLQGPLIMSPPTPLNAATPLGSPRPLKLRLDGIFTLTIGAPGKKTLAHWHVDSPQRIIDSLAEMAGLSDPAEDEPSDAAMAEAEEKGPEAAQ